MAINHRHWEQPPLDPMFNDRSADIRERGKPVAYGAARAGSKPEDAARFAELIGKSEVPFPALLGFMVQPAHVSVQPEREWGEQQTIAELGNYDTGSASINLRPLVGSSEGKQVETAVHELGHHLHLRNSAISGRRRASEEGLDPSNEALSTHFRERGLRKLPPTVRPHMEGVADGYMKRYTGRYAREELGVNSRGVSDIVESPYRGRWTGKNADAYESARAATERRGPALSDSYWSRSAGGIVPLPKSQITYDDSLPNAFPFSREEEEGVQEAIPGVRWNKFNVTDEQLAKRSQGLAAGDIDAANQAVALKKTKRRTPEEIAADKEAAAKAKQQKGLDQLSKNLTNLFNF